MMADETLQVRVEERLKIKIGEAKNLPGRSNGTASHRDPYCVLSLDQEEIFRTSVIEKTLNPFFGEEFEFEVPRRFRYLSIYVFDRDKHLKRDKVLGKVAIKREELHLYNNKDHWFALRSVCDDSEVQGEAHIDVVLQRSASLRTSVGTKRNLSAYCRLGRLGASATEPSLSARDRQGIRRCHPPNHPVIHPDESCLSADYSSDPERERCSDSPDSIVVRVLECSSLSCKDGRCDPYATVTLIYSDGSRTEKRTATCRGTSEPNFSENLCFPLRRQCGATAIEVRVALWHESTTPAFLGEVRLKPSKSNAWYFLSSRTSDSMNGSRGATPPGTRLSVKSGATLGSLRLLLQYNADHVFPLSEYAHLSSLLLNFNEPITSSAVFILGDVVSSKQDAAQPLVRLFAHHEKLEPLLRVLAQAEIEQLTDATTIFRGNTLVSKMMDEAMRLFGAQYLRSVLKPVLEVVLAERRPCEVDLARAKDSAHRPTNLNNLKEYVERVFTAIMTSAGQCPLAMRALLEAVRQCAVRHFPDNAEVRYSVVSGFVLLRFFAPAILGPRLFGLTDQHIDPQTNRTLTLISKTIQSLANLVSSRSSQQLCKEEYMVDLFKSFSTPKHIQAIKQFLEMISSSSETQKNNVQAEPVLLKEGVMLKRSECGSSGWRGGARRRHFRLTSAELMWASSAKKPSCAWRRMSLDAVTRVAPLHRAPTLQHNNMFQVVSRDKTLYIQANNCVERAEWVRLLRSLCPAAKDHLGHYTRFWSCCGATGPSAPGCSRAADVPPLPPLASALPSDPDSAPRTDVARDLQRIHTLLLRHTNQLDTRLRNLIQSGQANGSSAREIRAVRGLREATFALETRHRTYQRCIARTTHYGSKQAPIGEDNYLQLAGSADYQAALKASAGYLAMSSLKKHGVSMSPPASEYVDMRHADPHKCKEYELMSDFTSMAPAIPPRVPPMAPPRPPPPTCTAFTSPTITQSTDDTCSDSPPLLHSSSAEESSERELYEHKSLEQYDLKQICKQPPKATAENPSSSETPEKPAQKIDEAAQEEKNIQKDEQEIKARTFLRDAFHRKSNPTNEGSGSKLLPLRGSSSASDVGAIVGEGTICTPKFPPFFRRKSKPESFANAVQTSKKEESLFHKLKPKFSLRSHANNEKGAQGNSQADEPANTSQDKDGETQSRRGHLDSSLVANLQFLSLHRYGSDTSQAHT